MRKFSDFTSDAFSSHQVGSVQFGMEKGQGKREMEQLRNNIGAVFKEAQM